ncbi:hypothetical protein ILUMI_19686 [Ignelater luminosus]|uniref:Uncharacterized protein n=1 Tax=Ignelater luminosus TaxID=2038154 RepID=A0A8K0FZN1_IGNLU|nr:hypothetical protein ILUMI_19686 [Ignelater luminosus]
MPVEDSSMLKAKLHEAQYIQETCGVTSNKLIGDEQYKQLDIEKFKKFMEIVKDGMRRIQQEQSNQIKATVKREIEKQTYFPTSTKLKQIK